MKNGNISVQMAGITMMQVLSASSLDSRQVVNYYTCRMHNRLYFSNSVYLHERNIRECSSTLNVVLAHAAPPTQYKTFTFFFS